MERGVKSGNILVVDDDAGNRRLCSEVLSAAGYEVEACANGMEALRSLKGAYYDLVVTDINMPVLDGIDFYAKAVLEHSYLKDNFLFMTGDPAQDMRFTVLELDKRCLIKPFRITDLLGQVDILMLMSAGRFNAAGACGGRDKRRDERFGLSDDCWIFVEESRRGLTVAKGRDICGRGVKISYEGEPIEHGSMLTVTLNTSHANLLRGANAVWSKRLGRNESLSGVRFTEPMPVSSIFNLLQVKKHLIAS